MNVEAYLMYLICEWNLHFTYCVMNNVPQFLVNIFDINSVFAHVTFFEGWLQLALKSPQHFIAEIGSGASADFFVIPELSQQWN